LAKLHFRPFQLDLRSIHRVDSTCARARARAPLIILYIIY